MENYKRKRLLYSIVFFATHVKELSITQLMKYLANLDYRHFKETGNSVTGLTYYTYPKGDCSKTLHEEIKSRNTDLLDYVDIKEGKKGDYDSILFIPKKKFEEKYFSPRQLRILKDIVYIFKNSSAALMSKASHEKSKPWEKTVKEKGLYKEIDYMLTIEDKDFKEFILENKADSEKLEKVFS